MSLATDAQHRAPAIYAIPETAHAELVQLRDHLRLMAQLTAAGTNASSFDARLRPDALAWWFSRLERDIDGIVAASSFSMELAAAYDTAHKPRTKRAAAKD